MLRLEYDGRADALYIYLDDAIVARTIAIEAGTALDVDEHGRPVGVEIIRPGREWPIGEIINAAPFDDDMVDALKGAANHRDAYLSPGQVSTTSQRWHLEMLAT